MNLVLNIYRFNPGVDVNSYFQQFNVEVEEYQTVLDALLKAWQQDPGLSFRRSCRSTICGSCGVCINGKPGMACQTLIRDVAKDGQITVEPLSSFRVLKDLVVDLDPFFESLKAVIPWVVIREDYNGLMAPEVVHKLEGPATCILCAVCDAEMGDVGEVKPAALVKGLKIAGDPRDALGAARMKLMKVPPEVLKLFVKDLPEKCPKKIIIAQD